jgi:hypothetical protein
VSVVLMCRMIYVISDPAKPLGTQTIIPSVTSQGYEDRMLRKM